MISNQESRRLLLEKMKIKTEIEDLLEKVKEYILEVQKINDFEFNFTNVGITEFGKKINLGPSCYALKIFYMLKIWDDLDNNKKDQWVNYINSYQVERSDFAKNSYIDPGVTGYYNAKKIRSSFEDLVKVGLNTTKKFSFDLSKTKLTRAINAETKQAIATLSDIGKQNVHKLENQFVDNLGVERYLDKLNWSNPWSAGGQFASLCVYAKTQQFPFLANLENFSNKILDPETGSYFRDNPVSSREIINGAMKIISGLDWIDVPIHKPKNLIDFCLENKPQPEGCDIVDYVYVLYKCWKQTSYRKDEIIVVFKEILELFNNLNYHNGGFSYFPSKSQSHYYGVEVTKGLNTPDIHGTILITWALVLIYDFLEESNDKYNVIKP